MASVVLCDAACYMKLNAISARVLASLYECFSKKVKVSQLARQQIPPGCNADQARNNAEPGVKFKKVLQRIRHYPIFLIICALKYSSIEEQRLCLSMLAQAAFILIIARKINVERKRRHSRLMALRKAGYTALVSN